MTSSTTNTKNWSIEEFFGCISRGTQLRLNVWNNRKNNVIDQGDDDDNHDFDGNSNDLLWGKAIKNHYDNNSEHKKRTNSTISDSKCDDESSSNNNNNSDGDNNTRIPKIIHFIWLGDKSIPSFFSADNNDDDSNNPSADKASAATNTDGSSACAHTCNNEKNNEGEEGDYSYYNECMKSWKQQYINNNKNYSIHCWKDIDIVSMIETKKDTKPTLNDLFIDKFSSSTTRSNGTSATSETGSTCKTTRSNCYAMYNKDVLEYAMFDLKNYGLASDILRLELLYVYGGMYIDVDYICCSFDNSIGDSIFSKYAHYDFIIGASNTGCIEVNNGIIACKPKHPIIKKIMKSIKQWYNNLVKKQLDKDSEKEEQEPPESETISSLLNSFLDVQTQNSITKSKNISYRLDPIDIIKNTGPGIYTRIIGTILHNYYSCSSNEGDDFDDNIVVVDDSSDNSADVSINVNRLIVLPYNIFHPLPNNKRRLVLNNSYDLNKYITKGESMAIHLWGTSWM